MYEGKHSGRNGDVRPAKRKTGKKYLLLISAILVLTAAAGGTFAYLTERSAEPVVNSFSVATAPTPVIEEDFDGSVKKDVKVTLKKNKDSDAGAYFIRASYAVSLQDDEGNTVPIVPVDGSDYTISLNNANWTFYNGYYYYNGTKMAGESTENLIDSCISNNKEYHLVVDVVAQSIQADPARAAQTEWGYVPGT